MDEEDWGSKSRLRVLLDHFGRIGDPRDERRILHPLPEILLLVVCGTIPHRWAFRPIPGGQKPPQT